MLSTKTCVQLGLVAAAIVLLSQSKHLVRSAKVCGVQSRQLHSNGARRIEFGLVRQRSDKAEAESRVPAWALGELGQIKGTVPWTRH